MRILGDLLQLSLDRPARLLTIFVPAVVGLAFAWRRRRQRVAHASWPLAGLLLASALACLALAEPRVSLAPRPPRLIVLTDVSPSAPAAVSAAAAHWTDEARAAGRFGDVRVRAFGREDAVRSGTAAPGGAPELARALLAGAADGDPRHRDVLVLWSEGRDLDPRAERVAASLRDSGWTIFRGLPTNARRADELSPLDVAVRGIEGPSSPPGRGSRFGATASLAATRAARVHVHATQDDQALLVPGLAPDGSLSLRAGTTALPLVLAFPRERDATRVRVSVDVVGDAWPGNDAAETTFFAASSRFVWIVEAEPQRPRSEGARLASLLVPAGFEVRRISPARWADASRGAPAPSAVWLVDLAAGELPARALALLEENLRAGVGLVVTGGPHAFERGGYGESRLEKLLPVLTDDRIPAAEATLALLLVLDRSGSMAGPKLELTKEGARAAARLLPEGSWLGVTAFDAQPIPLVPLRPFSRRFGIDGDLERLSASGGTNILAGLRAAVDEMRGVRARRKHIILLSDGQSPAEGMGLLVDGARDAGMTISTVAVGDGADQHLLRQIATRGGGRAYFTADPSHLPRLFAAETLTLQRPPSPSARPRLTLPRPHPITAALDSRALPVPTDLARTRPRAQAEVLVASEQSPLLSCWAVSLGRACTYGASTASAADAAASRAPSPTAERLFTQLARYVAGKTLEEDGTLSVQHRGNVTEVRWAPPEDSDVFTAEAAFDDQRESDLAPASTGNGWRTSLRSPSPGRAQLSLHAETSKGTVRIARSVLVPDPGPATWLGEAAPAWWDALPIAREAATLTPFSEANAKAPRHSAPPPRREWPSKTSLLVAAAASVVASLWRWHRPRRPHGASALPP